MALQVRGLSWSQTRFIKMDGFRASDRPLRMAGSTGRKGARLGIAAFPAQGEVDGGRVAGAKVGSPPGRRAVAVVDIAPVVVVVVAVFITLVALVVVLVALVLLAVANNSAVVLVLGHRDGRGCSGRGREHGDVTGALHFGWWGARE